MVIVKYIVWRTNPDYWYAVDEIIQWVYEQPEADFVLRQNNVTNKHLVYDARFLNEEDAAAFKLKFGTESDRNRKT